jgi:hypothetical protein
MTSTITLKCPHCSSRSKYDVDITATSVSGEGSTTVIVSHPGIFICADCAEKFVLRIDNIPSIDFQTAEHVEAATVSSVQNKMVM